MPPIVCRTYCNSKCNRRYFGYSKLALTFSFKPYKKNIKKISTHLLARLGWFCPVASEPVKPYFTRLLRVLTFCLGVSKIVILKENGVVNGVVK